MTNRVPEDSTRRFRSLVFQGRPYHLDEDAAVRASDLERGVVTIVDESDGTRLIVTPEDLEHPPLDGLRSSDGPLFALRPLVEEILELGFSDFWFNEIIACVGRHLLLTGRKDGSA